MNGQIPAKKFETLPKDIQVKLLIDLSKNHQFPKQQQTLGTGTNYFQPFSVNEEQKKDLTSDFADAPTIYRKDRKSLPRVDPREQTLDDFKAKKYDYSIDNKMLLQGN